MGGQRSRQRGQQQQNPPLQSDRGNTTVQEIVVSKVAGLAAQEIEGVQMGGSTANAVGGFLGGVTGGGSNNQTRGVSVEVGQEEAAVDLTLSVEYGRSIPQVTEAVRQNIINRVENLVGLRVTEVNVVVNDVMLQEQRPYQGRQREVEQEAEQQEQSG